MDPTYVVTFFKTVSDSNGHCVDVEQGRVEISAPCQPSAAVIEDARRRFAASRGAADWRHRADYARVVLAEAAGNRNALRQRPGRRSAT